MNKRKTLIQKLKSELRILRKTIKKCNPKYLKKLEIDIGVLEKVCKDLEEEVKKLKRINGKLSITIFDLQHKKKFFRRIWDAIKGV